MASNKKVLLVEDVENMLELIRYAVDQTEGFEVSATAKNIWEARLEVERHRPDLVLLDEVLPGESAIDFLEELVEQGVPVVLVTSMEKPDHPVPPQAKGRWIKPTWDTVDEKSSELQDMLNKSIN